jgi:hypothetical protein
MSNLKECWLIMVLSKYDRNIAYYILVPTSELNEQQKAYLKIQTATDIVKSGLFPVTKRSWGNEILTKYILDTIDEDSIYKDMEIVDVLKHNYITNIVSI